MKLIRTPLKSLGLSFGLCLSVVFGIQTVMAAGGGGGPVPERQKWTFSGFFGTYDPNQLQRGFQVYKEVCASCHSMNLISFRNLYEAGGPEYSEDQVKSLAAEYTVADITVEDGERPARASDRFPAPFANDVEAAAANGGAIPPDFSVIAKARTYPYAMPENPFIRFFYSIGYFFKDALTGYQEAGADYIYALLVGYKDEAPAGFDLADGKSYNDYFPGHQISMAPPLSDELVEYAEGVPMTTDQYARDVTAFLMWTAEPKLVERKRIGMVSITFLIIFAALLYLSKRLLWRDAH